MIHNIKIHNINRYICSVALALLMMPPEMNAQSDSVPDMSHGKTTAHTIGFDLRPSWVVPTNAFLRGDESGDRPVTSAVSPHIRYSFKFSPETREGAWYPHAYQGVGISYTQFFKEAALGHPVNLYLFQGSRIASLSPKLSLDYEWNFGASAGWKKFDPVDNPEHGPIGSRVNAYINLSILLSYRIDSRWRLMAGVEGTHYSNGNTHFPNSGVNLVGGRIGLAYTIGEDRSGERPVAVEPFNPGMGYDLTVYGATRQRALVEYKGMVPEYIPGSFGVFGMNFAPMYSFNRYLRAGVSADFQYDESANLGKYRVPGSMDEDIKFYRQPFNKRFSVGLSLHAELTMPIFSINVGLGRNVIANGRDTEIFYQTLALKAYIFKGAYLQAGYQLRDFHEPNNLMLGVGYTFGKR